MRSKSSDTRSGRSRKAHAGALALSILLVLGVPGTPSRGDPVVTSEATPIGGGLISHAVAIDFQDGLSRSGFVEISFSGNFDVLQSQLEVGDWPDLLVADPGENDPSVYELRGGTGGGSNVDMVPVATLVLPTGEGFAYSAVISRNGRNFSVVPEPLASASTAAAFLSLAALRRRLR